MQRKFQERKQTTKTKVGGGPVAAGGLATIGVIASGVAGALTFGTSGIVGLAITAVVSATAGVGGVGTAATHHFASKNLREAEFRRIRWDFDPLLHFAYNLNEGVAQIHIYKESFISQQH